MPGNGRTHFYHTEVNIMAMVVQHNMSAMNANRNLGVTTGMQNHLRSYLPVTRSTVQQMTQQDFLFLRK